MGCNDKAVRVGDEELEELREALADLREKHFHYGHGYDREMDEMVGSPLSVVLYASKRIDELEAERDEARRNLKEARRRMDNARWKARAEYARRKYHEERRRRRMLEEGLADWSEYGRKAGSIAYKRAERIQQLQAAADQAISDLRVVATLAIGCEDENTILNIIDEVAARFAAIMESDTKEETST